MNDASAPARILDWDTAFFGVRIAQAGPPANPAAWSALKEWFSVNQVQCAYSLCPADDFQAQQSLQANGFRFVDCRMTLRRGLTDKQPMTTAAKVRWRMAAAGDLQALRDLAGVSHRQTRFYADGRFPLDQCDALYRVWIERDLTLPDAAVWIPDVDGTAQGYLTCQRMAEGKGRIGLFAVAPRWQGQGIGRGLLAAGLAWFAAEGVREVEVATQANNTAALRTYERAGFWTDKTECWFHRWFK